MDILYKKFNDEYHQSCAYNTNVTFNFETGTHLSPCFVFEPRFNWGSKPFNVRFKGISCKGRHKVKVMNT